MIQKTKHLLKHFFIPHEGNDYKPHFFKEHIMLSVLIGSLLLLLISYTSFKVIRTTTFGSNVTVSVLIDLTNQTRKLYNLKPLAVNEKLLVAAELKGKDMVTRNYFSHYAPDGTSPWYFINQAGYEFLFAGENLAVNFKNSAQVQEAWLASKKHKDNIISSQYEDIGIATVPAVVDSKPVIFVVQMFGTQASSTHSGLQQKNAYMYEKVLFNATYYISYLYRILIVIIITALLLMIFIEIRKQHIRHVVYGILLGLIVTICMQINSYLLS